MIGCGDVSVVHLDALARMPQVRLVGVCDVHPGRRAAAGAAGGVPGFADPGRLLDAVQPDVVHICTPHHLHADLAAQCLERGVHVVLEKPPARTVAEGERLVAVAERSAEPGAARIAVCLQNRYNPPVRALRRLLDSGRLGPVQGCTATVLWHRTAAYYRDRPWRGRWATAGGGLLMNQAIHTVDLLQWLLGAVTGVSGHCATRVLGPVIEVEDTAEMVLEHAGGARSVLFATLAHVTDAPVSLEVATERAVVHLRGDLAVAWRNGAVDVVGEQQGPAVGRSYWGLSHEALLRDFYARLDDPEPFWLGPREAMASLRIVHEVYAQSGVVIPAPPAG